MRCQKNLPILRIGRESVVRKYTPRFKCIFILADSLAVCHVRLCTCIFLHVVLLDTSSSERSPPDDSFLFERRGS